MPDTPRYGRIDADYARRLATTPPDEDGTVWMVNLMHYRERADYGADPTGEATIKHGGFVRRSRTDLAPDGRTFPRSPSAFAHGARVPGWFAIEGTIIGDGRQWHQARFNAFPSKRAFMAVVADPERRRAQSEHREGALADTYTTILRPTIDRLASSVGAAPKPQPV